MNLVERHGSVRAMRTTLEGELGANTEVEVSAVGDRWPAALFWPRHSRCDIAGRRGTAPGQARPLERIPDAPLESIVRSSIEAIERQHIVEALAQAGGNRTMAAKALRLSRQSLHAKLKKYRLEITRGLVERPAGRSGLWQSLSPRRPHSEQRIFRTASVNRSISRVDSAARSVAGGSRIRSDYRPGKRQRGRSISASPQVQGRDCARSAGTFGSGRADICRTA